MTVDERRAEVIDLHNRGWSQHRIAKAVGCSQSTVRQDLRKAFRKNEDWLAKFSPKDREIIETKVRQIAFVAMRNNYESRLMFYEDLADSCAGKGDVENMLWNEWIAGVIRLWLEMDFD